MKVGIPRETVDGERRVALVPDGVRRLVDGGVEVVVEAGAGTEAAFVDAAYAEAGATLGGAGEALGADVVCKVQRPSDAEVAALREGSVLVGLLQPLVSPEVT